MQNPTSIKLCKAIIEITSYMTNDEWMNQTRRVYAKTFTIVELYNDGLCKPTDAAQGRLHDLYKVLVGERNRRWLATTDCK